MRGTVRLLQGTWACVLLLCEVAVLQLAVFRCAWPVPATMLLGDTPRRILVLTDPQLTDFYSYKQSGVTLALTQYYSDVYMRKAFRMMTEMQPPADAVLMLGDMFDGGRILTPEQFAGHAERFEHVFERGSDLPMYNLSGNHDTGLGSYCRVEAVQAYKDYFGPTNFHVQLGNFSIIGINAPALFSKVTCPEEEKRTRDFIDAVKSKLMTSSDIGPAPRDYGVQEGTLFSSVGVDEYGVAPPNVAHFPRILLTHIPLNRPNRADCGPERRNSRPLVDGSGVSYRNFIDIEHSLNILDSVRPVLVLSGDDHEVCNHTHADTVDVSTMDASGTYSASPVEFTAGTVSWLQGERHPSFAMLSLYNPPGVDFSYGLHMCRLPDRILLYIVYIVLAIVSVVVLLVRSMSNAGLGLLRVGGATQRDSRKRPIGRFWLQLRAGGIKQACVLLCSAIGPISWPFAQVAGGAIAVYALIHTVEY